MIIGVTGDTHNNLKNISTICSIFNENRADLVLHTGDISLPKSLLAFKDLKCPIIAVLGNNDIGEEKELSCEGIFVEIGNVPTTEMVKDVVELDDYNRIVIDPWTQKTSTEGIWSAGDCTNSKYHQNNIAAGDAVKALEDIYVWVKKNK